MTDAVTVAAVGAGGALLGSVIAVLPTFWVESRRARTAREADERKADAELREAGRLVAEELREARRLLEQAARRRRFWPGLRDMPTTVWDQYRHVLAVRLGPADWASVAVAYDAVARLNWTVNERRGRVVTVESRSEGEQIQPEDDLEHVWREVEAALYLLDSEVGIPQRIEQHLARLERDARELWSAVR